MFTLCSRWHSVKTVFKLKLSVQTVFKLCSNVNTLCVNTLCLSCVQTEHSVFKLCEHYEKWAPGISRVAVRKILFFLILNKLHTSPHISDTTGYQIISLVPLLVPATSFSLVLAKSFPPLVPTISFPCAGPSLTFSRPSFPSTWPGDGK